MNRFCLAAALVLTPAAAFAADVGQPAPVFAAPIASPAFDWTGFYIGANAGYGSGEAEISAGGGSVDWDIDGFVGGVQAGYNAQFNQFVFGVEADIQYSGIEGTLAVAPVEIDSELEYYGTLRARAGFAFDRVLPYVTGGLAWGRNEGSISVGAASISESNTHVGWTAGAGLEFAMTDAISLRGEYSYTDLGDEEYFGVVDGDVSFHAVRIGVNYRF